MKDLRINQEIDVNQVMLIDSEGKSFGVVNRDQALYLAFEAGLDLVQVNSSNPPVAKIMDYGKYRYAQEKQESKQKSHTKAPEIKELRLSVKISPHDLDVKVKQARKFLEQGDKVKVTVKLIGREMIFKEKVRETLEIFRSESGGLYESPIEKMGNRFSSILIKNESKNETKDS